MATVLLVGILMACISARLDSSRRQHQAVDAIVRGGGRVLYDYEFDKFGDMYEHSHPNGPRWLRSILGDDFFNNVVKVQLAKGGLEHLTSLIAVNRVEVNYPLTSADMRYIEELTHLKHLRSLGVETHEGDIIVDHFAVLSQLRYLRLEDTCVSPSGLERLRAALPNCEVTLGRSRSFKTFSSE
jgi:hypothetical protein